MENNSEKRPVLITGATGFIGNSLVEQFIKLDVPVRVFVRDPGKADKWRKSGVEVFNGNLKDLVRVEEACGGVGLIYHLAELPVIGKKRERHNLEVVRRLIGRALHRERKRIVFLSSLSVAGVPKESPSTEDTPASRYIHDPYTTYKYKAEQLLRAANVEDGLDYVIVRPPIVYGPGSKYLRGLIDFLDKYGKYGVPYVGSKDKIVPILHVEDLARLLYSVAYDPKATAKIIHAVDDSRVTIEDFITRIGQQLGKTLKIRPLPKWVMKLLAAPVDAVSDLLGLPFGIGGMLEFASAETVYSNIRMKARLSGPLRYPTLKEGLPTLVDWYRETKALSEKNKS